MGLNRSRFLFLFLSFVYLRKKGLSDCICIDLKNFKTLFNSEADRKKQCEEVTYILSNKKKAFASVYKNQVIMKIKPLGLGKRAKELELPSFSITGCSNHTPTIGLLGMETLGIFFDEKMERVLYRKKNRVIGERKLITVKAVPYKKHKNE